MRAPRQPRAASRAASAASAGLPSTSSPCTTTRVGAEDERLRHARGGRRGLLTREPLARSARRLAVEPALVDIARHRRRMRSRPRQAARGAAARRTRGADARADDTLAQVTGRARCTISLPCNRFATPPRTRLRTLLDGQPTTAGEGRVRLADGRRSGARTRRARRSGADGTLRLAPRDDGVAQGAAARPADAARAARDTGSAPTSSKRIVIESSSESERFPHA